MLAVLAELMLLLSRQKTVRREYRFGNKVLLRRADDVLERQLS